ncbi:MAG: plasmid stabilization protein [Hydrogenophilales bacterium CG03_land_8_20_14_0_80_62_28]|nr:type II toxin-antitoxin system RelE/ParE family toxin [Betaproteobacteria bacterium]PIV22836.1 MAG: plasmid stabilization protein [Hydrogenophilales bacterium CG03_land_8_20_14_0_80_62_28]PIW37905.1 MAG: plasmid stabilization protein [Hydrogenophilales bacterium CG15_BIG_FIL_POST_REV_8_21_14_020_62_31]PIW71481.1 MAG: plasmid stabilization protein [Hydrogenophilales bacterium CG12_big_fil_rev_8_21_14_0_65_61_21]PIX01986.1 MAG: plasmid stabilization protein [Hydrogenophilales bacterium CG_4_8_
MPHLKLSGTARADIKRLYEFLAQFDVMIADNGNAAIIAGLEYLEVNPISGAPMEDRPNVRKMVVNFGASGYLIFHKRYEKIDTTLVTRIIHQKEWYDAETIGFTEEKMEKTKV